METERKLSGNTNHILLKDDIRSLEQRIRFLELEFSKAKGSLIVIIIVLNLVLNPLVKLLLDALLAK